ncbi:hypothetical protein OR1_03966 [Geobacter sp. OR-1]|uniref:hypothetical protein n=1 Tax=Geobacter sp. OR-1 TaxID=1266765 RepID=UPI00054253A0|nr:hypothetical protein [Geobacter sp. OR-1]GAM11650.1 hypothetical protein OR1_03966 [Geobacter sp. OR-1]
MSKRIWFKSLLMLVLLICAFGQTALAAPAVRVNKTGNNIWTVYGSGFEQIGGLTLSIQYETTLKNPEVINGEVISGALVSTNISVPGKIGLAAAQSTPFPRSSGVIATIKFGSGTGRITSITPTTATADNNPHLVDSTSEITNSGDIAGSGSGSTTTDTFDTSKNITTPSSSTNTGSSPTPTSSSQGAWLGGVTMQTDISSTGDRKEQPKQPESVAEPSRTTPTAEANRIASEPDKQTTEEKKEKQPRFVTTSSVLKQFKDYKGERTPKEMVTLFTTEGKGFQQVPPIFLADGKGTLKVLIPVDTSASASPNFAISKEAQMASFPKIVEDNWVVELKPKKGVYQATLSYFLDEVTTDIPITVAPLFDSFSGKPFAKMTESDLAQFLKTPDTAKADLSKDLNGDKVVDYIDDYIFVANYLVQAPQSKGGSAQPKQKAPDNTKNTDK